MATHSGSRQGRKPGTAGRAVQVTTNSFPVVNLPANTFYQYDVGERGTVFLDVIDGQFNRRRNLLVWFNLQVQYAAIFNPRAAYDGEKNMFRATILDLPNNAGNFVVYLNGNATEARRKQLPGINVKLTLVGRINPSSLVAVLRGHRGATMGSEELTSIMLLNVLVKMAPLLICINKNTNNPDPHPSTARSFFVQSKSVDIGKGLEMWRGYFQSVRPSIDRLIVNVDVTSAVMYQGGPLISLAMNFLGFNNVAKLGIPDVDERTIRILDGFLTGLLVSYTMSDPERPGRPKKYKTIKSVENFCANEFKFDWKGRRCTISEYFWRTYNYTIKYGQMICVNLSSNRQVILPMEVLDVKPGQFYKRVLSPAETARAIKFSSPSPKERLDDIKDAWKSEVFAYSDSDLLRFSGMTIATAPMVIPARTLAPLKITYGDNFEENPINGAWNVMNRKFVVPISVPSWAVMVFDQDISLKEAEGFAISLQKACAALGMNFTSSRPPFILGNPQGNYESLARQFDDACGSAERTFRGKPSFILVILPEFAPDIITAVKYWGDCQKGCPTQCVKRSKIRKANNQYCNNVALKVNIRIGGVNWYPSESLYVMQYLKSSPIMVVGADVSHAGPDTQRPSVAGLVSSVDEKMCRYVASTSVQESRVEGIIGLGDMMANAITMFDRYQQVVHHQSNPLKGVIFYRDGLSEGQFDVVAREEIRIIQTVFQRLNVNAKLVYIVVGKRHHIRFFPPNGGGDRSGNCEAGLVVDQVLVHPIEYDFYLQSHTGILGTSRSAHYTVLLDELDLPSDGIQGITFVLCHVYGRATRSVSIPAPVYYADLVCGRATYHSLLFRGGGESSTLEEHKEAFCKIHRRMETSMYWI
ncbi:Piwi domain-containing protein [Hysterangium stoloniferum]|nr:Piwi domain-containing protein [Hysterangium stoloniferum]